MLILNIKKVKINCHFLSKVIKNSCSFIIKKVRVNFSITFICRKNNNQIDNIVLNVSPNK